MPQPGETKICVSCRRQSTSRYANQSSSSSFTGQTQQKSRFWTVILNWGCQSFLLFCYQRFRMPCMLAGGVLLCLFHAEVMGRVHQLQLIQLSHTLTLIPWKEHLKTLKDTLKSESMDLLNFKLVSLFWIFECMF